VSDGRSQGAAARCRVQVLVFLMLGVGAGTASQAGQPLLARPIVAQTSGVETFNFDRFGAVTLYRSSGHPHDVAILISDDAGWGDEAANLARKLADKDTVVAGIDIRRYREQTEQSSESCLSPSSDFENLSHYLQSKLALKRYLTPSLVGIGAGANLAYATLAEAPDGLFKGAISVGFCPSLTLKKPVCSGPDKVGGKWIVLQGETDSLCSVETVKRFATPVHGSEVFVLPHVGHDFTPGPWTATLQASYARLAATRPDTRSPALPAVLADLPLVVVPAVANDASEWFAVFLTGDGGWVALDKEIAAELARHNIPIVGWDSLKYFWTKRTPDGAARDLDRVLRYYARTWHRSHVLLIGYSQGADTMPFMVNRLPATTHELVGFTALLGISDNAVWEFHVASWLGTPSKGIPTAPELASWSGAPYFCLYGESDPDAACAAETGHDGTFLKVPGGHHFNGSYVQVANEILSRLPAK
jgi:type IV secretory pathway VirJ component